MRDRRGEKDNFIAGSECHPERYSTAIEDLREASRHRFLSRLVDKGIRERERELSSFVIRANSIGLFQSGQSQFKFRGRSYIDPARDYTRDVRRRVAANGGKTFSAGYLG